MQGMTMALLRVRRAAQLTLPVDVRRALNVKDGDYLEAHVIKDGVLLKPVAVIERKRAWREIKKAVSHVAQTNPKKTGELDIAREVKAMRRR